MKLLYQGAEAQLFMTKDGILKRRVKKNYRHPVLDSLLRKRRTSLEARMLNKINRLGIRVPRVLESKGTDLLLEFIQGERVKEALPALSKDKRTTLYTLIGEAIASLHEGGIMHGDLTTSNLLLGDGKVTVIDFGLARPSTRVEDQAVDLFLLYESLRATHTSLAEEAWKGLVNAYKTKAPNAKDVLAQFEKIRQRRRYMKE